MGICTSSNVNHVYEATANVMMKDGSIQKFCDPVKVKHILKANPGHFVCICDGLYIGQYISELLPHEEVRLGQLYFLLARRKLEFVLSASDMGALLLKAARAMSMTGDGNVHPLFKMDPYSGEEEMESFCSSAGTMCGVSRQTNGSKQQQKCNLETIAEVS